VTFNWASCFESSLGKPPRHTTIATSIFELRPAYTAVSSDPDSDQSPFLPGCYCTRGPSFSSPSTTRSTLFGVYHRTLCPRGRRWCSPCVLSPSPFASLPARPVFAWAGRTPCRRLLRPSFPRLSYPLLLRLWHDIFFEL